MSENHISRFFKRNKLKPRKLDVNSPELSNTINHKNSSTIIQGKKLTYLITTLYQISKIM